MIAGGDLGAAAGVGIPALRVGQGECLRPEVGVAGDVGVGRVGLGDHY